jgi:sugar lactone lactonase YvrE
MRRRLTQLLLFTTLTLVGCAKKPGVIFEPLANPIVWPAPPDVARIRYVGQLATSLDLKPGKGAFEGLGEALFGKKDSYSMLSPFGLCTDGRNRLFVADTGAQCVHVFDLQTRKYQRLTPPKPLTFSQPVAVAHHDGRVLVSDSTGRCLHAFSTDGTYQAQLAPTGVFERPAGVAIQPATGNLYVADVMAHHIVILSPDGLLLSRMGTRGNGPGEFNYPTNLCFDSAGRLYVSDSLNFRVQQFAPDGSFIRQIGRQGDVPGAFSQPKGLAVDADDHLYVVDARFENVQIFNADGDLLLYFGEEGSARGQFWLPSGIHIDPNNRVWIADTYNRRVAVFDYLSVALPDRAARPTTVPRVDVPGPTPSVRPFESATRPSPEGRP